MFFFPIGVNSKIEFFYLPMTKLDECEINSSKKCCLTELVSGGTNIVCFKPAGMRLIKSDFVSIRNSLINEYRAFLYRRTFRTTRPTNANLRLFFFSFSVSNFYEFLCYASKCLHRTVSTLQSESVHLQRRIILLHKPYQNDSIQ